MSSRRLVRRPLVALLVGVLVGGGLMAVTPAGAEVSNAVATNWKKIWNKELKPQADQRYYTKKKSNKRYYTKSDSDAKYQPKGNYALTGSSYTKAESDSRYAPLPGVLRGAFELTGNAAAAGNGASDDISFGVTFASAPAVHVIGPGDVPPAGCSGSLEAPNAAPGNLCIFQRANFNVAPIVVCTVANSCDTAPLGKANAFGAWVFAFSSAAGYFESGGSWAARPAGLGTGALSPTVTGSDPSVRGGS